MAITKTEVQVTWPTAVNSKSVAATASQDSETVTIDPTSFEIGILVKADNNGTPAAGDTVTFEALFSTGDPDGTGANEFASNSHGLFIALVDTNAEDPALEYIVIPMAAKEMKVRATNNAATNGITVSATLIEVRG